MQPPYLYSLRHQHLWLSAQKVIFWEEERALVLSDLHLGKSGHFRKSGIAIPPQIYLQDLQKLFTLIQHFQPAQLIVVGDMFHSHDNQEIQLFRKWREDLSELSIHLIKGNHDILSPDRYASLGLTVYEKTWLKPPFLFVHDTPEVLPEVSPVAPYILSGHIHPGVHLKGAGKQSLRFPCFYFGEQQGILPAFSAFTGTKAIQPSKGDHCYAIVENSLLSLVR